MSRSTWMRVSDPAAKNPLAERTKPKRYEQQHFDDLEHRINRMHRGGSWLHASHNLLSACRQFRH